MDLIEPGTIAAEPDTITRAILDVFESLLAPDIFDASETGLKRFSNAIAVGLHTIITEQISSGRALGVSSGDLVGLEIEGSSSRLAFSSTIATSETTLTLNICQLYDTSGGDVPLTLPDNPQQDDQVGVKEVILDDAFQLSVIAPAGAIVENPYTGAKDAICSFFGAGGVGTCIVWQAHLVDGDPNDVIWFVVGKTPYTV
jgi:hypothetical protein